VDFTAFGGGAAVAATDDEGTWTASYTIAAGSIDGTDKNISVAATDDAGNATTTADGTDASLDNVAPTVTDEYISISGATGTDGVYKIVDVVTATWDNTASGVANATLVRSVVDSASFGGAAVTATDDGGTWTASYTLMAGSI